MPRVRLDLDTETYESLVAHASAELRPVQLHAEVLLRQALGLPFPYPVHPATPTSDKSKQCDGTDDDSGRE